MIWTDGNRICADSKAELIAYAKERKMCKSWFINHDTHGYFQIFGHLRRLIMHDTSGIDGKGTDRKVSYLINKDEFISKAKAMYQHEKILNSNDLLP